MGFYFNEFDTDKKQHINLSNDAWLIIDQDMKNFFLNKTNECGFLNTVFENYYEFADASIYLRYMSKKEFLNKLFDEIEFKNLLDKFKENTLKKSILNKLKSGSEFADLDEKTKEIITSKEFINKIFDDNLFNDFNEKFKEIVITKIADNYKDELLEKALSYPKGSYTKFRINKDNFRYLKCDCMENKYYKDLGDYIRAVFQEYAEKPNHIREQIFFRKTMDTIKLAIDNSKKLKFNIKQKLNVSKNEYRTRKFYVAPYKVVQDATKSYNYLIGIAEELLPDGTICEKKISSFRISRIENIDMMKSLPCFLSADKKAEIEKAIVNKLPQFMAGETIDIKIKFTEKGIESFSRQLYMRPSNYDIVDDEENTYIFHCTEIQAINYFIKFLRDIEILEPAYLREKFINRYRDALNVYLKDDTNE